MTQPARKPTSIAVIVALYAYVAAFTVAVIGFAARSDSDRRGPHDLAIAVACVIWCRCLRAAGSADARRP